MGPPINNGTQSAINTNRQAIFIKGHGLDKKYQKFPELYPILPLHWRNHLFLRWYPQDKLRCTENLFFIELWIKNGSYQLIIISYQMRGNNKL
jgi:hypothetical protein